LAAAFVLHSLRMPEFLPESRAQSQKFLRLPAPTALFRRHGGLPFGEPSPPFLPGSFCVRVFAVQNLPQRSRQVRDHMLHRRYPGALNPAALKRRNTVAASIRSRPILPHVLHVRILPQLSSKFRPTSPSGSCHAPGHYDSVPRLAAGEPVLFAPIRRIIGDRNRFSASSRGQSRFPARAFRPFRQLPDLIHDVVSADLPDEAGPMELFVHIRPGPADD
jgi:hypothetical protein